MRVFVTGGSGFVGQAVISRLLSAGHQPVALLNQSGMPARADVEIVRGSLFDAAVLDSAVRTCQAVIHLVGIIFENPSKQVTFERIHVDGTRAVLEASKRAGGLRYLQMSALGARADAPSRYHQTKARAEQLVRASGMSWTILQPSLIHGPRGEFMQTEAKWARRTAPPFLFMPYFGGGVFGERGAGMLQPVFVEDVARAFVDALGIAATVGKTYPLVGPTVMSWPHMHHLVSEILIGHRRLALPMPVWIAKIFCAIGLARLAGFNRDQVLMSQEDNTGDGRPLIRDFGFEPEEMGAALKRYAGEM